MGFEPTLPPVNIAGREMHPLTSDDLARGHLAYAGNVNMRGDPLPDAVAHQRHYARQVAQQTAQDAAQQFGENQAEALMPDFLRDDQGASVAPQGHMGSTAPQPPPGPPGAPPPAPPSGGDGRGPGGPDNSATVVSALLQEAERARQSGDPLLGVRLQKMAEAAIVDTTVRRTPPKVERSLILDKLRRNLGLKAIKSAAVEWGGMKWHFAPAPAQVDYWLYTQLPEEPLSRVMVAPALGVSTGLVGLDDTPLWKVFNLPILTEYEIDVPGLGQTLPHVERVPISLHSKLCPGCAHEVKVDAEKCAYCGAAQDLMDVPATLRIQYAEKMYEWLQNEFGPFERLNELWKLMTDLVKMRSEAKDETYPLLDWSAKQTTTPTSPPGDE